MAATARIAPRPDSVATADDPTAAIDLVQFAEDGIRTKIATAFKGHNLSTLIGAVLETQGYRVVVSPPGADGGVDINCRQRPTRLRPD